LQIPYQRIEYSKKQRLGAKPGQAMGCGVKKSEIATPLISQDNP
jgi:hypothetical protein